MSIENIFPNKAQLDAQNAILNRIADKLGAYEEPLTWAALQAAVRAGNVGLFLQPGDQVEVDTAEILTAAVTGEGITSATVDRDAFLAAAGTHAADYEFAYDGHAWHYNGRAVTLSDYGISVAGTPANGDTVEVHRSATAWDYDVQGIDEDEPVNADLGHVLTIQSHKIFAYGSVPYDPVQFLFAVTADACTAFGWPDTGMPAGTYNIVLDHGAFDGSTSEDGTYQFTTSQIIPVGGGIRHSYMGSSQSTYQKANVLAGTFTSYGADKTTVIEGNIATTEGNDGTNIGTATAKDPTYRQGDYINFTQRQRYGSNRWSTSFIRQYLNSDEETMTFRPATIWSRPLDTMPEGFLHVLDPELRAVLCKVRTRYALSVADGSGYEDIEDLVKPETSLDVYGSQNNSIYEGPVDAEGNVTRQTRYTFWKTRTNKEDRIKRENTTARNWWLASCYPTTACRGRIIGDSGSSADNGALNAAGIVPCLHIG